MAWAWGPTGDGMPLKVSTRGAVAPFIVMDVMRAAFAREAAGGDVLHLEVGQPSTPAPAPVLEVAREMLGRDRLGYTEAFGLSALRARIARHYRDAHGVEVDPGRIVVTTGSSGGFTVAFLAAFEAGDRVGVASPGYPAYRNILTALGCEVVDIEVGPETRFQPTAALLERRGLGLDGLIVASPSNPTGTLLDSGEMAALVAWCRGNGVRLISDEIYHGITYGVPATTAAGLDDQVIVVNSFSKYFSMTGWRIGWMVLPEALLRSAECLTQNMFISAPTLSQHAAIAVFDCGPELAANVRRYRANRDILLAELPKAGLGKLAPADGAFYLYADVGHLTNDSPEFCRRMLAEIGVAITPGIDFDPTRGHRTLRISFAGATDQMAEAARRLAAWLT